MNVLKKGTHLLFKTNPPIQFTLSVSSCKYLMKQSPLQNVLNPYFSNVSTKKKLINNKITKF